MSHSKIKTVAYKGSKRKLLDNILELTKETNPTSVFDGFSGTGIVGAMFRRNGYEVYSNDMNHSSYIYGKVFLEGFNPSVVSKHLEIMNNLKPSYGWLTENYSGTVERKVRGKSGLHLRTLGLTETNAMKIDSARDYIESVPHLNEQDKNALIFSVILGLDSVFNNSNDQKSSLKEWSTKSLKSVVFKPPTLIQGKMGKQYKGDIFSLSLDKDFDVVYLDPPYTSGVLYASSYHLNDSLAIWDKPLLDKEYAIPRPARASFKDRQAGSFYSKKTVEFDFYSLMSKFSFKRMILSYSDAPRNTTNLDTLCEIAQIFGNIQVYSVDHKICAQYNTQTKRSENLKEFFVVIDR